LREIAETLERRVQERTADLSTALDRLQREVADRERAEEALRQAQKMEAVGRLTGGIAHDFNNLLTPVIGGLEMIARRVEEPRLKRLAQAALESSQRGAKLATQLLAFSRLQRLSMSPVAVNQVIDGMQRMIRHTIGPRIAVEAEFAPEPLHAMCDANQLENAILNLAINARDAMPEGGRLRIVTALEELAAEADLQAGTYVSILVEDDGQGMAPAVLARAMEPFFSTKAVGKGTGLGLAQVYGIAQQSGGAVRIDSREGQGTTVRVLLPHVDADSADGSAAAAHGPASARHPRRRLAIMVVDDDPDVLRFLVNALEESGHQVTACTEAQGALQRLDEAAPDLVLIDFAMPGMNGAQLAREIRSRRPDQPILFVSGYAETDQLEAAVGPDAAVLRKPFTMAELAAALDAVNVAPKSISTS
jgi:signal transduction histidine kinase/CheY-like chemotaxis protein